MRNIAEVDDRSIIKPFPTGVTAAAAAACIVHTHETKHPDISCVVVWRIGGACMQKKNRGCSEWRVKAINMCSTRTLGDVKCDIMEGNMWQRLSENRG